jgi:hypothetical protein
VNSSGLFGWLPGRRAAAQRRRHTRRSALAGLEFALAELDHELRRLAALSHTAEQDDAAAVARETTTTARILEVLARGERFASQLPDGELASGWRRLAAGAGKARLLGQGPHRAAKLEAAAVECEQLQQLVSRELADLEGLRERPTGST